MPVVLMQIHPCISVVNRKTVVIAVWFVAWKACECGPGLRHRRPFSGIRLLIFDTKREVWALKQSLDAPCTDVAASGSDGNQPRGTIADNYQVFADFR